MYIIAGATNPMCHIAVVIGKTGFSLQTEQVQGETKIKWSVGERQCYFSYPSAVSNTYTWKQIEDLPQGFEIQKGLEELKQFARTWQGKQYGLAGQNCGYFAREMVLYAFG